MLNRGTKILIIDYEPRGIKQLNDPLAGAGFDIRIAKDGVAGIESFHAEKPDLVLIEAMLPKRHGFEVCQELKRTEHGRRTPIIIVTSVYKGRKYRSQAIHHYGCDEYLEKPVAPEALLQTVERLLPRRKPAAVTRATKPVAASPSPDPTPADHTPPTPSPVEPTPVDAAETEIADRLDEILGGKGPSGGSG